MRRAALMLLTTTAIAASGIGQGRVVSEERMRSERLGDERMVRIYLPSSYGRDVQRRFPVLYVHDGQNMFTTVGANVAFGWGNWGLDRIVNERSASNRMQEIIMVTIDCSAQRYLDYRGPAYPYSEAELKEAAQPPAAPGDNSRYENYARFLIEELKPRIDRDYRTLPDAANTGVLGASLGGLCSLALAWERPDVFGKAASVSGAFQVERTNFLANVLRPYRGPPKAVRVYLDSGVTSGVGDDGRKNTEAVAAELRRIGWRDKIDLLHYVDAKPLTEAELEKTGLRGDKWNEAQTTQHNEFYWRQRVWRALEFMFPAR